jgi:hypothetical protein
VSWAAIPSPALPGVESTISSAIDGGGAGALLGRLNSQVAQTAAMMLEKITIPMTIHRPETPGCKCGAVESVIY